MMQLGFRSHLDFMGVEAVEVLASLMPVSAGCEPGLLPSKRVQRPFLKLAPVQVKVPASLVLVVLGVSLASCIASEFSAPL